jgi:hypothetical protein
MRRTFLLAVTLAALACKDPAKPLSKPSECETDDFCGTGIVGGPGGTGSGGGGGGGVSSTTSTGTGTVTDVTGRVSVVTGTLFDLASLFTGEATIEGPQAGGGTAKAYYDPAIPGFDLKNVAAGQGWIFATDLLSPTQPVLPTYTPMYLIPGSSANLDVPVLDRENLGIIAASIGAALSESYAQVILQVNRGGNPLKDVSVFGDVGGAKIGYDVDGLPGQYSGTSSATGGTGFILLINAAAPLSGDLVVSLLDLDQNEFTIPVRVARGAATLLSVDLD